MKHSKEKIIYPVLESLTDDSVEEYYNQCLDFYKAIKHRFGSNVRIIGKGHRRNISTALLGSINPQFAGLLLSYVRRQLDAPLPCPLCVLNDEIHNGCFYFSNRTDLRLPSYCPARQWCLDIEQRPSTKSRDDAAYELVKSECKKLGVSTEWLQRIMEV